MSSKERAILVFSKTPRPGMVKTRLRPQIGKTACLSLHLALLQDTITKVARIKADAILYLTEESNLPFVVGFPTKQQRGKDLGERMQNAFESELKRYSKVLIIGIDSPTLPPITLEKAFEKLDCYDIVLGPCEDGGYYLIALKDLLIEPFSGIPWGTSRVFQKTLEVLRNKDVCTLQKMYDVDRPQDLRKLKEELAINKAPYLEHTRKWFKGLKI